MDIVCSVEGMELEDALTSIFVVVSLSSTPHPPAITQQLHSYVFLRLSFLCVAGLYCTITELDCIGWRQRGFNPRNDNEKIFGSL